MPSVCLRTDSRGCGRPGILRMHCRPRGSGGWTRRWPQTPGGRVQAARKTAMPGSREEGGQVRSHPAGAGRAERGQRLEAGGVSWLQEVHVPFFYFMLYCTVLCFLSFHFVSFLYFYVCIRFTVCYFMSLFDFSFYHFIFIISSYFMSLFYFLKRFTSFRERESTRRGSRGQGRGPQAEGSSTGRRA